MPAIAKHATIDPALLSKAGRHRHIRQQNHYATPNPSVAGPNQRKEQPAITGPRTITPIRSNLGKTLPDPAYSGQARYRVKGLYFCSPDAGLMRWHHHAGLLFGVTTFTGVLSGCLSLDPGGWHPSTAATNEQRTAFSGGPLRVDEITPALIRAVSGSAVGFRTRCRQSD